MSTFLAALIVISCPLHAQLLVAAASDLAPLTAELSRAFEKATGSKVVFTLSSSGTLKRQIENGAPFDVYLSANEQFVRELADSGAILAGSFTVYAEGRLGWMGKPGITTIQDLRRARLIAVPNPAHAPYGVAARKYLKNIGLWDALQPRIVLAENVRQAMQYFESGNVDAVITAWTLLKDKGMQIPASEHPPIRQAGGVVARSSQPQLAGRFLAWLRTATVARMLTNAGLAVP
ncbi:MAG: molybdate ABC transporter substrate-binding protein [Bryobacteraceae bacterium]|nr:molybdate ABC transporter substrate-binding protein [Bryobacteraceae bacterium]